MRNLICLGLLFLLFSCESKVKYEKPEDLITKEQMIDLLYDIHLANGTTGVKNKDRLKRAEKLLDMVDLSKRMLHKPSEMSGGEQQRVAIARALSNDPSIILADEPTGNVDTKSGNRIMGILEDINNKGETVITVTHDPNVAKRAKRILKIQDGVVSEENA